MPSSFSPRSSRGTCAWPPASLSRGSPSRHCTRTRACGCTRPRSGRLSRAGVWLHAAALGAPAACNACSCPTSTGRQRGLAGLRAALGRVSLLARHGPVALRDGVYGVLLARPGAGRVAGRSAGVCGEGPAVRVRMLRRRRPNPARCTRVVRCCGACTHTRDMRGQVHVHERACMLKHTHQHEAHK